MAWISTVDPKSANGELADIYQRIAGSRGGVAAVHQIQSLNPKAIVAHLELYKTIVFRKSHLSRISRERIAVMVSATNQCQYCIRHHAEALHNLNDDPDIVARIELAEIPPQIDVKERELLRWVQKSTLEPYKSSEESVKKLRQVGWDDEAILSATLTCAYFNFVNRIVLMLGVHIEQEFAQTCKDEIV